MANYSLEADMRGGYNPFAYKEFQGAIDKAVEKQEKLQDEYSDLRDKAFAVGALLDPNDTDAYNMYHTYMNMLESGANELMRNGLNYGSKRQMQDIKSLYNRYMVPIANAYAARAAEIKSQQDAYDKDNSIRYEREAAATNLSDYLRNPNLHARSASGRNIMANVSAMLQNVALGARNGDENSQGILRRMFGNNIDYEYVYNHGFDLNTIADAMANIDDPKYAALKQMVIQAKKDEGYDEWADQATKDYMHDWALSGLAAAIGRTEVGERRNTLAYLDAEEAMQNRIWDHQHQQPPLTEGDLVEYLSTVMPIINNEELYEDATTHGARTIIVDGEEKLAYVKNNQIRTKTLDASEIPAFLAQLSLVRGKQFREVQFKNKEYKIKGSLQELNLNASTTSDPGSGVKSVAVVALPAGTVKLENGQLNDKSVAVVRMRVNGKLKEYLLPDDFSNYGIGQMLRANDQLESLTRKQINNSNDYYSYLMGVAAAAQEFEKGVANMTSRSTTKKTENTSGVPISVYNP